METNVTFILSCTAWFTVLFGVRYLPTRYLRREKESTCDATGDGSCARVTE